MLCTDAPLPEHSPDLAWQGAYERLKALCMELGDAELPNRISRQRDGVCS
jgi:hypothetical protein